ncbi:hypothetical protein ACFQ3K_04555 [Brucella gallinifaecis]|uniref:BON domain-containing protein n=1 Tax=Brucella gallinifaecis TaxID=215590 RepID=A0A502BQG1_9HYPH|nr:hypothetical protein [Brucella gallinifaecis]TPF76029.1 hypothetical protein FHY56_04995 [Brucella gallinifaecis]
MLKWFWPTLTWTAALTSLAVWFGADRVETDIGERIARALLPYSWAGFDIDGRDIALKGMAPDPESHKAAVQVVQDIRGIGDFSDLTTMLEAASPYIFRLSQSDEGVILSGYIPDNSMRDAIMSAAESGGAGRLVDDQMALARGAQPEFEARVLFAVDLAKKLSVAEVEISDGALSVEGKVRDDKSLHAIMTELNGPLPYGLSLVRSNIVKF